jgi:hypothetical protein
MSCETQKEYWYNAWQESKTMILYLRALALGNPDDLDITVEKVGTPGGHPENGTRIAIRFPGSDLEESCTYFPESWWDDLVQYVIESHIVKDS